MSYSCHICGHKANYLRNGTWLCTEHSEEIKKEERSLMIIIENLALKNIMERYLLKKKEENERDKV